MKKTFLLIILILTSNLYARIRVVTSYPYIKDIAERIGKKEVKVFSLSKGTFDPHYIVPRPSLIAKLRRADLLIVNGAELEIGWLPPVIRKSHNSKVQPGRDGYLDLSRFVKLIDVPKYISRRHGDIHPSGNPHFYLDPHNIPILAVNIQKRLCVIDQKRCSYYKRNYQQFVVKWQKYFQQLKPLIEKIKGKKAIQYHKILDYFLLRFEIKRVMEIESLPGIPPSSRHIRRVIDRAKREKIDFIIMDVYHSSAPARFISKRTGINIVILPHDVNATKGARDIFALFDDIIRRLSK